MADYHVYNQSPTAGVGDSPKVFAEGVINDIEIAKRNALGDTIASAPNGHLQAIDIGGGRIQFQIQTANGVKNALAGEYILQEDLDFNQKQALAMILEKVITASIPAASAANEGRVVWDDDLELVTAIGTTLRFYLAQTNILGTTFAAVDLETDTKPATNPTAVTKNSIDGFLFDAAGEQLGLRCLEGVPTGWTGLHDVEVELLVALNQGETDNDDIDFKVVTFQSVVEPGEGFGKATSGPIAAVLKDIGTGSDDGDLHRVRLPIPRADGTNPTNAGNAMRIVIERNTLPEVGGVVLYESKLLVPLRNFNAR